MPLAKIGNTSGRVLSRTITVTILIPSSKHAAEYIGYPFFYRDNDDVRIRCNPLESTSWPDTETATVQAGSTIGFRVGEAGAYNVKDGRIFHEGPAQAFLSKTNDLAHYQGDGDWFKIQEIGAKNRTKWELDGQQYVVSDSYLSSLMVFLTCWGHALMNMPICRWSSRSQRKLRLERTCSARNISLASTRMGIILRSTRLALMSRLKGLAAVRYSLPGITVPKVFLHGWLTNM
jgi:hypothetical protein